MKIIESYPQEEYSTLLEADNGKLYYVEFEVIEKVTQTASGFIDYDSPLETEETEIEIELYDCYVSDEGLQKIDRTTLKEDNTIIDYLTNAYED